MNVGELKELLDDYGDHVEVRLTDDDLTEFAGIERVDTVNQPDGTWVVLIAE